MKALKVIWAFLITYKHFGIMGIVGLLAIFLALGYLLYLFDKRKKSKNKQQQQTEI